MSRRARRAERRVLKQAAKDSKRGGTNDASGGSFDDGFAAGDVRVVVPADSAIDADVGDMTQDMVGDLADEVVLNELSNAFGGGAVATIERTTTDLGDDNRSATHGTTITIGGDDDLPDAKYLDEELAGDDDEGTVFIDDDGQGDAILPKDATGPGIEPRLRQRRIGVRRAEGRRRLKWVIIVALVVVVAVGVLATLGSGLFAVDDVRVSGEQYADPAAVQAVVDDLEGTPTLLVDVSDAERRLEEIAWVESARVRTDFPNTVTIELRERVPLATVRGADENFRIIDREGRVLAIETGQPIAPVLITGPGTLDLSVGQYADIGYAAAASLVRKLSPEVRSRLVSMSTVADGSDIRLVLTNRLLTGDPAPDIEVRLGAAVGDNEQIERLVRLERVLDDIDGAATTIIDVSTEETTER